MVFKLNAQIMTDSFGDDTFKRFLHHQNCTESCPEDCSENGWLVRGQDGSYYDDFISIKCGK